MGGHEGARVLTDPLESVLLHVSKRNGTAGNGTSSRMPPQLKSYLRTKIERYCMHERGMAWVKKEGAFCVCEGS